MKKALIATGILVPVLLGGAYLVYQNLPQKRYARHMIKARLYAKENNFTAAQDEYRKAYEATGEYTPYTSLEVLNFTNALNLRENRVPEAIENTRLFLKQEPENKDALLTLTQLTLGTGDTESAFQALNNLLHKHPHYFPGRLLLAKIRTQQGRLDLAEEQLRILYGKFPDSAASLLPLAENLLRQGRVQESRTFLLQVLSDHQDLGSAHMLLLDSYLLERKVDSAQLVLDNWKKVSPDLALPLQIRKVKIMALSGDLAKAQESLAPYLNGKPENLAAYGEMAVFQVQGGNLDSALSLYASMVEVSERSRSSVDPLRVFLHFKNGNPARALELLKTMQIGSRDAANVPLTLAAYAAIGQDGRIEALLEQQPDSVQPRLREFLAQLPHDREFIGQWALVNFYSTNRLEVWATQEAQKLHQRWPDNTLARTLFVSKLSEMRRYAEAAKVLEGLKQPNLTQSLVLLNLYIKVGNRPKSIALAEKLRRENPKLPGLNLMLADFHWTNMEKEKGIASYEKELAINPDNLPALNNLAWEYGVVRKDLEKAQPYLDRLARHKLLDPRIMDTIGWILALNGKGGEAESHLRNALDLVPDHPTFLYHLAFVLVQQGKKEEARRLLESALATRRDFGERKDAEKLLSEMG